MYKYHYLAKIFVLCLFGIYLTTPVLATGLFLPYVTYPMASSPEAAAIGDVNNDGLNDVVVATTDKAFVNEPDDDHKVHVFLQQANGDLLLSAKYDVTGAFYVYQPTSVDIGDLNNDGRNDIVVNTNNAIGIFLQNSSGTMDPMVTYPSTSSYRVRVGDFNSDGRQDVVSLASNVDVFLQNSSGTMNPSVAYVVTHGGNDDLEVGDVNNDGRQDIVILSGKTLGILLQNSSGTMNSPVYYVLTDAPITNGVAVGDINGDGRDDVAVTYNYNVAAFYQNVSGTLDAPVNYASSGDTKPVDIGDVNGDGLGDVVSAGGPTLEVHLQGSNGSLLPYELYTIPYETHYPLHSLEIGDINNDGANDVVLANNEAGQGLIVVYGMAQMPQIMPIPDIKVNSSDGPVTVRRSMNVSVTASVDAGTEGGQLYDWWMGALTPFGKYWVNRYQLWVKSSTPVSMGQIEMYTMPTTEMLKRTLPIGSYRFFFILDSIPNGVLDDMTNKDYVDVKSKF
jgi:hypothetical protein